MPHTLSARIKGNKTKMANSENSKPQIKKIPTKKKTERNTNDRARYVRLGKMFSYKLTCDWCLFFDRFETDPMKNEEINNPKQY